MRCRECKRDVPRVAGVYQCCSWSRVLWQPGDCGRDDRGWVQAGEAVVIDLAPTAMELAQRARRYAEQPCRDCDQPFQPNNTVQVRCTPCAVETRKVQNSVRRAEAQAYREELARINAATAKRGEAYLRNRRRLDKQVAA